MATVSKPEPWTDCEKAETAVMRAGRGLVTSMQDAATEFHRVAYLRLAFDTQYGVTEVINDLEEFIRRLKSEAADRGVLY